MKLKVLDMIIFLILKTSEKWKKYIIVVNQFWTNFLIIQIFNSYQTNITFHS